MTSKKWTSGLRAIFVILATYCLMTFAPRIGHAQDLNDSALWTVNQIAVPLNEQWTAHLMVQNRWVRNVESYQRTVARQWLSFDWTERVELALGYDAHEFENPTDRLESRVWQRIAYHNDLGIPTLLAHFWLEERIFQGSSEVAWRGRFQVGASFELPGDFGALIRNEFFFDLNSTSRIRRTGLGEDQLFIGLSHPVVRGVAIEFGYLMQYLDRRGPDQFNHGPIIGFSVRTPSLGDIFGK